MGLQLAESRAEAALEKQALLQAQLEEQLRDKVLHEKDLAQQQMQSDLDKDHLSARWVPGGCCTRQASLQKSGPGSGASSEAESGEGSGQQGPH
ncbi:rootletin-like [Gorilla gorilla gorilla]|uniref:rootletin-like n=1 Tax=Gorilla gorilla gorilla TaxID=9595 RepID=UPI0024463997|nr:rootletin-like [Gorilla gorilla gorilla]